MTSQNSKRIILHFTFSFCISVFAFCIPTLAQAATLYFSPSSGTYKLNQTFQVGIFVSSAGQAVNGYSGVISFPTDKIQVVSIALDGSIVNFWVREPSFSNTAGRVNFEGVTFNPGFQGIGGKIITVSFVGRAGGIASLGFAESSVLAADGHGTNVLRSVSGAQFNIGDRMVLTPPATVGVPSVPNISSPTHPDPDKWYANNSPKFVWKVPDDVTAVRLLAGRIARAKPNVLYEPPISERQLKDLADGVWYFSAQFKNIEGWGAIGRFQFQIDTQEPTRFEMAQIEREDLTEPRVSFLFEAEDRTSGISHYTIFLNGEEIEQWKDDVKGIYTTAVLEPGSYDILVRATDFAGNYLERNSSFEIKPLPTPLITSYPDRISPGESVFLQGTSLSLVTVEVWIQRKGETAIMQETKADDKGNWSLWIQPLEKGRYTFWAVAVNEVGARSKKSPEVEVRVELPLVFRFAKIAISYLTIIIILIVLIIGALVVVFYGWYRISLWRKRLRRETKEVSRSVMSAFRALREEMKEQIEFLDGKPGLNKDERQVRDRLKEALNISEEFISKEITDIEKELK